MLPLREWNSTLIYDHAGTNPTITSEWLSTYIWHARNQSYHHDRMAQHLHMTMEGTNPLTMSEWLSVPNWGFLVTDQVPPFSHRMASALTSDHGRAQPAPMLEWPNPYIWPWKEPILSPCQNGSWTHHFPFEGTSIWRTPSFSLKYSNFTLANGLVNTSAIYSTRASLLLSAPYL